MPTPAVTAWNICPSLDYTIYENYCTVFESDKMSSVNADIDLIVLLVDNVILDFVNV